jgi:hypothetical protein
MTRGRTETGKRALICTTGRLTTGDRLAHNARHSERQDLKSKTPAELVSFAEESGVENASTMRKQELMFAILKQLAIQEIDIIGEGVVEVKAAPGKSA